MISNTYALRNASPSPKPDIIMIEGKSSSAVPGNQRSYSSVVSRKQTKNSEFQAVLTWVSSDAPVQLVRVPVTAISTSKTYVALQSLQSASTVLTVYQSGEGLVEF